MNCVFMTYGDGSAAAPSIKLSGWPVVKGPLGTKYCMAVCMPRMLRMDGEGELPQYLCSQCEILKFSDGQVGAKVVRLILITAASGHNSAVKKCQYILSVARQIQTRQLLTLQLLIREKFAVCMFECTLNYN